MINLDSSEAQNEIPNKYYFFLHDIDMETNRPIRAYQVKRTTYVTDEEGEPIKITKKTPVEKIKKFAMGVLKRMRKSMKKKYKARIKKLKGNKRKFYAQKPIQKQIEAIQAKKAAIVRNILERQRASSVAQIGAQQTQSNRVQLRPVTNEAERQRLQIDAERQRSEAKLEAERQKAEAQKQKDEAELQELNKLLQLKQKEFELKLIEDKKETEQLFREQNNQLVKFISEQPKYQQNLLTDFAKAMQLKDKNLLQNIKLIAQSNGVPKGTLQNIMDRIEDLEETAEEGMKLLEYRMSKLGGPNIQPRVITDKDLFDEEKIEEKLRADEELQETKEEAKQFAKETMEEEPERIKRNIDITADEFDKRTEENRKPTLLERATTMATKPVKMLVDKVAFEIEKLKYDPRKTVEEKEPLNELVEDYDLKYVSDDDDDELEVFLTPRGDFSPGSPPSTPVIPDPRLPPPPSVAELESKEESSADQEAQSSEVKQSADQEEPTSKIEQKLTEKIEESQAEIEKRKQEEIKQPEKQKESSGAQTGEQEPPKLPALELTGKIKELVGDGPNFIDKPIPEKIRVKGKSGTLLIIGKNASGNMIGYEMKGGRAEGIDPSFTKNLRRMQNIIKTYFDRPLTEDQVGKFLKEAIKDSKAGLVPKIRKDIQIIPYVKGKSGSGREESEEPIEKRDFLYDDEVFRILKPYGKKFAGVADIDNFDKLMSKVWDQGRYKFGLVINTSPENKPGEHWQALYFDPFGEQSIEFYDSYGDDPDKELVTRLENFIEDINLPIKLKLKINKVRHQNDKSDHCGYFATRFLTNKFDGSNFKEATNFHSDDDNSSDSDSDQDEQEHSSTSGAKDQTRRAEKQIKKEKEIIRKKIAFGFI